MTPIDRAVGTLLGKRKRATEQQGYHSAAEGDAGNRTRVQGFAAPVPDDVRPGQH